MLILFGLMLTLALAGLVARGNWAARGPMAGLSGRELHPQDVSEIGFTLEDLAIRYRGFNRRSATSELGRVLTRRTRRSLRVVTASTETCDTLGRSTFLVLDDGTVFRLDTPEATVEGEPWAMTNHLEDLVLESRLSAVRVAGTGLEVHFNDGSRHIFVRAQGGAFVGAHAAVDAA